MINKPIFKIAYAIALLCPVVSAAACFDSNDPAKSRTAGNYCYKTEYHLAGLANEVTNQPASEQKTVDQSEFSALESYATSNDNKKVGARKGPEDSETYLDNYEWTPAEWYEVY